jgi:hypothetical protein
MRHVSFLSIVLAAAFLSSAGCRKRQGKPATSTPSGPEATEAAASVGIDPKALPSHQALYDAITKHMTLNGGRAAKNVEELVQRGLLKPLPALPPGKRYELDQRSAILTIVDN